MIRKFWLINGKGQKYSLNAENTNNVIGYLPQNLGMSKAFSTVRFGDQEDLITDKHAMPTPAIELVFRKKTNAGKYQDYQDFIQFAKIKPLKFYQLTPNIFGGSDDENAWYIDCDIASLQKSEVDYTDKEMHVFMQLKGFSFWKTAKQYDLVVEDVSSGGKIYDYEYDYTYEGNSFGHIDLINNGTMETGFILEINDEITDPVLSLFQKDEFDNEIKYGEVKILGTYDKISIDTRDSKQSIYLEYQGSVIANPTDKFDLSNNGDFKMPFPKLKVGENILTFAFGGTFTKAVHIKWQDLFSTI